MDHRDLESHSQINCRDNPDMEEMWLAEEMLFHEPNTPFGRVLSSFEFRINGKPIAIDQQFLLDDGLRDLEVVGITGTIYNKEGLFGQCAWFGNHDLDWFWVRIQGIRTLRVCEDLRFRRGQKCVWMETLLGQYALILPHDSFRDMWEQTLAGLGALEAKASMWPACGFRPSWWNDKWKDDWPFEKDTGAELSSLWPFAGSPNNVRRGELSTNLSHITTPWAIQPENGMAATRSLQPGSKRKQSTTIEGDSSTGPEPGELPVTTARRGKRRGTRGMRR